MINFDLLGMEAQIIATSKTRRLKILQECRNILIGERPDNFNRVPARAVVFPNENLGQLFKSCCWAFMLTVYYPVLLSDKYAGPRSKFCKLHEYIE